ncbi:MAG TPA: hypothetical protein PLW24_06755 [Burkholderiaceae bacterium]|nr:hypothetical protein [Burkholderiaceae bacterium]
MSCEHCASAQKDADWAGYQARCRGCQVRALANGPAFFESARAQRISPAYRAALEKLLGPDWQASHREVRAEFDRLQAMKNPVDNDQPTPKP